MLGAFFLRHNVDAAYCYRRHGVVCLYVTDMSSAKTGEPIEMSFDKWARVAPHNHVMGGPDPPRGRGNFGVGKGPSSSKCNG